MLRHKQASLNHKVRLVDRIFILLKSFRKKAIYSVQKWKNS